MAFNVAEHKWNITIESSYPDNRSLYPTIVFNLRFSSKANVTLILTPVFRVRTSQTQTFVEIGYLQFETPTIRLEKHRDAQIRARLVLSHYGLKQIENIRKNGDIHFSIWCAMDVLDSTLKHNHTSGGFDTKIAKSDWVEKYLSVFNYMEVSLLEVPKIDFPDFAEAAELLNDAWKKKHKGEFSEVMVACRKAIQYTTTAMKKAGFVTKDENDKKIPDWGQLAGTANIGEINGTITKKISGFIAPGAHHGKNFNVEDADYALMITHATVNYALKKLQSST